MEATVFDYKISLEELNCLFIIQSTQAEYREHTTTKKRLKDLYVLFKIRNDRKMAAEIGTRLFRKNNTEKAA